MESVAQIKKEFLRVFGENLAKVKYGLVEEQKYHQVPLSELAGYSSGRRVEVAGHIRNLARVMSQEGCHQWYEGIMYDGNFSLQFERADYTVCGNTFKSPATLFDQRPFTLDQYQLELRCLSGFEGLVSMRGKIQQREGSPLLLVERIVDFKEKYQQDAA